MPVRVIRHLHNEDLVAHENIGTTDSGKDTSYEAAFTVMTSEMAICALNIGNIARFINHGCYPNAMFVECHSRRSEKDPLIPRIGVLALRDIPLGEEVTVAYWPEDELRSATLSKVPCKCGGDNCIQFLQIEV